MITSNGSSQPSASKLLGEIFSDFQELLRQQMALIRTEVLADWRKTKEAGLLLWVSVIPLACGSLLLAFMLAHLLYWLTLPADIEQGKLPIWACYGITGAVLVGAGTVCLMSGWRKLQTVNPLKGESVHALEDNVHWLKARIAGENSLEQDDSWTRRGEFRSSAEL
jgi:hypothetical protein